MLSEEHNLLVEKCVQARREAEAEKQGQEGTSESLDGSSDDDDRDFNDALIESCIS